ncbi:MAG: Lin0512 family protein [Pseudomonadota bacterium]
MADQRFIIEMGMGNDQYGLDYTKASARAIEDAIRHSALPLFEATGLHHHQMRVQVTVGVQKPDAVDCDALAQNLPRGRVTVTAVFGGLDVENPDTGKTLVIASAAVEAFLPYQGE